MKKEKTKKNNKLQNAIYSERGITLISLVITIIVLIILAGISINLVLGENGLFNRARKAAEEYKQAAIDEQKMTNDLEEGIDKIANDNRPKTIEEAKESNYGYFYEKTTLEDSDKNKIVIPVGFKIAEDSGNNVTEGIVIEDKDITTDGEGEQRGNQYVWIPVSNIDNKGSNPIIKSNGEKIEITLGRYTFGTNGTEILKQTAGDYEKETIIELSSYYKEIVKYQPGVTSDDLNGQNRTAKDLAGFISSVKENGGYYIARYEASYGKDNKPNSKISNEFIDEDGSVPTAEGCLWNYITQKKAAEACENMYDTVSSDLVNSYAWDTAIVYIQKFSGRTEYSRQLGNSINANLANTGANKDEVCKINDMASNCREWTTECSSPTLSFDSSACVSRGGDYYGNRYTSVRYILHANLSGKLTAFRTTLYINTPAS